jgi:hypothetical protein
MVYVTTGNSYSDPTADTSDGFLAFRMETGELVWSRQMTAGDAYTVACAGGDQANCPDARGPDFDFGSSPILVDLPNGRHALIAGQKSGMVHAIDPDMQGAILWHADTHHTVIAGKALLKILHGDMQYMEIFVLDLGNGPNFGGADGLRNGDGVAFGLTEKLGGKGMIGL